uniref:HTH CENPB-type domain-containing protein n=1 Tax=Amphimedon queenslandica TaxID=400682 RepID=A0A1X7STD0_AMPQE
MAAAPVKRNELSLKRRIEVLDYIDRNPGCGARKVATVFDCEETQIQSIIKKALEIARSLDKDTTFKASNGWLDCFKKRHGIQQMTVSGECGDVSEATVTGWHDRVKSLIAGYSPEDIWNTDETGCFYRALPDKSLSDKAKQCRGGKKAKERLTISLFANAAGGKEAPIVIGKSASPRCFKGLRNKKCPHGLPYYANKKAWMNIDVMDEVILQLNKKMDKFSNVKVIFLHANTTSRLQPQDAGIIKNFKVKYMKKVLKYMLARVNEEDDTTASTICKSVDILMAIRWIKEAWEEVTEQTVTKCLRHWYY